MLADDIAECARSATTRVTLVAPFMKCETVARVIAPMRKEIDLTCVTRWRLYEIAVGVSDPEVWPLIRDQGGRLLLRDDLHAKAYMFDDRCLVGSANLTDAALGHGPLPNLELLLEVPCSTPEIVALEAAIKEQTVEVDDSIFEAVLDAAAAFKSARSLQAQTPDSVGGTSPGWLPTLRSPELLFDAYAGNFSRLTSAAIETAGEDLRHLAIPPRLGRKAFESAVAVTLLQTPLIAGIDRLLATPRRFGDVRDYLSRHSDATDRDRNSAWQTLIRWLRHFMPARYVLSVPHISEIMIRRDALQRLLDRT